MTHNNPEERSVEDWVELAQKYRDVLYRKQHMLYIGEKQDYGQLCESMRNACDAIDALITNHHHQLQKAREEEQSRINQLRYFVARLYCAGGCSCCQDTETWNEAAAVLAVMLGIPAYDDGSGFDFYKVRDEGDALPTQVTE